MKALFRPVMALVFTASAWASGPVDGTQPAERIFPALEQILTHAAQQSPRMLSRSLDLEIAENSRIQARSAVLPSVAASYRLLESRDDRVDLGYATNVQKSYYDIALNQPLFHWGERFNTKRIGEIQKAMAQRNYTEAYRGLAQEVRARYLQLIVQKQSVKRARAALVFSGQQVKLAEKRLAKAEISELEMAPLRFAEEQGQLNLERWEFDFAQAKLSFSRLTGLPELTDDQIPDDIPTITYEAAVFDRMLAGYLSMKDLPTGEAANARQQVEVSELSYKNEKTRLRPKIGLYAGANQDQQSYTINNGARYGVNSLYAGVSVNWQIFDGFMSQAATRSALARLRQSRIESDEVRNRLAQQAQQQAKLIYFAARSMVIADRGYGGAEATIQIKQADFTRGVATESDVALARITLIDMRIAAFNARMDYLGRVGDFLGTLAVDPVLSNLQTK